MSTEGEGGPDSDPLQGQYANYLKVGYNAFEFLLDFGQLHSESLEPRIHTRIITGPAYAKAMLVVLRDSIARYEQAFGVIEGGE